MNFYPAKSEKARWIDRPNAAILLNPEAGIYRKLNNTAAWIWRSCDGTKTIGQIAAALSDSYSVTRYRAQRDICLLLSHLKGDGFIKLYRNPSRFYPSKSSLFI